jgi:3-hydroxyisobutyrate dehydrogenase
MMKIGFIGLGNMGGPMAANLVKAGHTVTGFDLVPAALDSVAAKGIEIAPTAAAAVANAEAVITMLPAGAHVLSTYKELVSGAPKGAMFIDCSTIDVADAREAHILAEAAGMRALDAPVSGGVGGASAGTLTFMCGGTEDDFKCAEKLLSAMGRRIVHCGGAGAGQAAKLCNNMILGITMAAVSEAFVLGEALGLSHQALFDVAANASGQCWALTTNCPVPGPVPASPANRDYAPGFAAALMLKDMKLAAKAAEANGVAAELGKHATEIFAHYVENGGAATDFSGVINYVRKNGT